MSLSEIQLFQILKLKLGENEAEGLVAFVKTNVQDEFENRKETLATKEDLNALKIATRDDINALRIATKEDINALSISTKEEINGLRISTKEEINGLRISTKEEINGLRISTKEDMATLRSDLTRSIYLVGLGQFVAILAAVLAIINFMK